MDSDDHATALCAGHPRQEVPGEYRGLIVMVSASLALLVVDEVPGDQDRAA